MCPGKYKLYVTQGQGSGSPEGEYDTLDEALNVALLGIERGEDSFGIKYPDGNWHKWEDQYVTKTRTD